MSLSRSARLAERHSPAPWPLAVLLYVVLGIGFGFALRACASVTKPRPSAQTKAIEEGNAKPPGADPGGSK